MPGVAALITIALANAGIGFGAAIFIGKLVVGIITSVVLSFVSRLLSPKPKTPNLSSFSSQASNRTLTIRQPITPWRFLYGEARVAGPMTFLEVTGDNRFLHMVVTLGAHPFDAVIAHQLDDTLIFTDQLDGSGNVTSGRYSGKVRIQVDLGTTGAQPFPDLVSETTKWLSTHHQDGHTKAYIRFEFDRDKFPSGVPNYSAWGRGKKLFDPRTSTTVWTPNVALALRDYMLLATKDGGLGGAGPEFDDTDGNAAANICDEFVTTKPSAHTVAIVGAVNDTLRFDGTGLKFQTGDRVQITTTGTLPGGLALATDYFVIVDHPGTGRRIKLASSYVNALAGAAVDITSAGSGTHTVTKNAEPRYTANGVVETDTRRSEIVEDLAISMGGRAVNSGGVWRLAAAAFVAPTLTFDETDARGSLRIDTKIGRRDRFNAIKGIYVSPLNNGVPTDYPAVTNATYETEDNNERIFRDLDLPFTSRSSMAQRLAKIELERARQEITFTMPLSLSGMRLRAGITASITNARMGWSAKAFECTNWGLATRDNDGAPEFIVNPVFRETASAVFDWNLGEETTVDPAPNTNLPDAFNVTAPTGLTITSGTGTLFLKADGTVLSRIKVAWTASTDSFVERIEIQFKKSADATWEPSLLVPAEVTASFIWDVEDGVAYDVRIRAVNTFGVRSAFVTETDHTVLGKSAPPADVTGFSAQQNGDVVTFQWNQVPDLDRAGYIIKRSDQGAFVFATAELVTEETKGTLVTNAFLAPGAHTVGIKAVDTSGNESVNAVTFDITVTLAPSTATVLDQPENPRWAGTLTDMVVHDVSGRLVPKSNNTDAGDGVFSAFVRNPVPTCRYEAEEIDFGFDAEQVRVFSERTLGLGPGESGAIDSTFEIDFRKDADAYDGFEPWTIGLIDARFVKQRLTLNTALSVPFISAFRPKGTVDARTEALQDKAVSIGGSSFVWAKRFHLKPTVTVTPDGAAAVFPVKSNVSTTGVDVKVFDSGAVDVGGTVDVIAIGT
ncbi:MAG: hypothetical protein IH904_00140 [Proteobacteria bacterium]|nr:hypothetical protein [Pseudomonadota bacterium]